MTNKTFTEILLKWIFGGESLKEPTQKSKNLRSWKQLLKLLRPLFQIIWVFQESFFTIFY